MLLSLNYKYCSRASSRSRQKSSWEILRFVAINMILGTRYKLRFFVGGGANYVIRTNFQGIVIPNLIQPFCLNQIFPPHQG